MYDYYRNALPEVFTDFFVQVNRKQLWKALRSGINNLKILSKDAFKRQHSSCLIDQQMQLTDQD